MNDSQLLKSCTDYTSLCAEYIDLCDRLLSEKDAANEAFTEHLELLYLQFKAEAEAFQVVFRAAKLP